MPRYWLASAYRILSLLAVASARARWAAAMAWLCAPMREKWRDRKRETCPSRRGSSRATARASASRRCARIPLVAGRHERRGEGKPEIDGLLARVTPLWQMREGAEWRLEKSHG